jgi:predicted patatin/cPLA2 family phospholipase
MKTALVVEGGAMRGLYAAGVLDVFLEQDIHADGVIGVSAGAIHGCSYVSKQKGRSIRYYCKYSKHKNFMSWYSFFTTGEIVGRKFCYDELPNKLDPFDNHTFMASEQDFYATVTNCETGKAEYMLCKDLNKEIDKLRASASMPLVSKMVDIDGGKYLDGGVSDSIPIKKAQELGYDKIVVVLTRPRGYRKSSEKLTRLYKMKYRKYPKLIEAIQNRAEEYNATLDYLEKLENEGKIVVIRPSEDLHISRMEKNPVRLTELYNLARKDAVDKLKELRAYL